MTYEGLIIHSDSNYVLDAYGDITIWPIDGTQTQIWELDSEGYLVN